MFEVLLSLELLSCGEFDYLMAGLTKSDMPIEIKQDLYEEMVQWTPKECFDTQDAND